MQWRNPGSLHLTVESYPKQVVCNRVYAKAGLILNKEFWHNLENEVNIKWILVWVFPEISVGWSLDLKFSTHNLHYQFVKYHHKYVCDGGPVISLQVFNYDAI